MNKNFNSIKVRLEPSQGVGSIAAPSAFQFHKGTIRTLTKNNGSFYVHVFQFHKGTIRTQIVVFLFMLRLYFNSIKVRLEPLTNITKKFREIFQFHKGTIRTVSKTLHTPQNSEFQFHKGTIRTEHQSIGVCRIIEFQFHKGTIRTR